MSDIDWCIQHSRTLSLKIYAEHFHITCKSQANNRYKNILSSKAFYKGCTNAASLQRQFDQWQGSYEESLFWADRTLDTTRSLAKRKLEADGVQTALQYGLLGGESLRQEGESSM